LHQVVEQQRRVDAVPDRGNGRLDGVGATYDHRQMEAGGGRKRYDDRSHDSHGHGAGAPFTPPLHYSPVSSPRGRKAQHPPSASDSPPKGPTHVVGAQLASPLQRAAKAVAAAAADGAPPPDNPLMGFGERQHGGVKPGVVAKGRLFAFQGNPTRGNPTRGGAQDGDALAKQKDKADAKNRARRESRRVADLQGKVDEAVAAANGAAAAVRDALERADLNGPGGDPSGRPRDHPKDDRQVERETPLQQLRQQRPTKPGGSAGASDDRPGGAAAAVAASARKNPVGCRSPGLADSGPVHRSGPADGPVPKQQSSGRSSARFNMISGAWTGD
jgi:hypothetical protein